MLYFKPCPRCRGDMKLDRDLYGSYKLCLQCGYMIDIADVQGYDLPLKRQQAQRKRQHTEKVA